MIVKELLEKLKTLDSESKVVLHAKGTVTLGVEIENLRVISDVIRPPKTIVILDYYALED